MYKFVYILLAIFCFNTAAQLPFGTAHNPNKEPFIVEIIKQGDGAVVNFTIEPGHYIYKDKITLNDKVIAGLPEGKTITIGREKFNVIQSSFTIKLNQAGTLSWQGCSNNGFCYPPNAIVINFGTTVWSWLKFFTIGLLLSFTPCVLPMIPITLATIKGKFMLGRALTHAIGIIAGYAILGALFSLSGSWAGTTSDVWLKIVLAGLLSALALVQLEVLHIKNLGWQNVLTGVQDKMRDFGLTGVFMVGAISAFAVSPCLTPGLVGALTLLKNESMNTAILSMALVGAGLALPLITVSIFGRALLPKSGPWQSYINKLIALCLLIIAANLIFSSLSFAYSEAVVFSLSVALTLIIFNKYNISKAAIAGILSLNVYIYLMPTVPYTKITDSVATVETEQNTFVSISADWCTSCKHLERKLVRSDEFKQALGTKSWIKLDITDMTAAQQSWLQKKGIFGPPAFLWQNGDQVEQIVQGADSLEPILQRLNKEQINVNLQPTSANMRPS